MIHANALPLVVSLALGLNTYAQSPYSKDQIRLPQLGIPWSFDSDRGVQFGAISGTYIDADSIDKEYAPSKSGRGETTRTLHDRLAIRLPISPKTPDSEWYVDVIPESGEGFRLISPGGERVMGSHAIVGFFQIPEGTQIKALRLYKNGNFMGEILNNENGVEPDIRFSVQNGIVAWKVMGKVPIQRIMISTNKGKKWHSLMPIDKPVMQSGSWKVDFEEGTEALISLECTVGNLNFFRKEILVKKGD